MPPVRLSRASVLDLGLFKIQDISQRLAKLSRDRRNAPLLLLAEVRPFKNRQKQIFPPGIDEVETTACMDSSHPPASFAPEQLCYLLEAYQDPHQHDQSIIVRSAQIGKPRTFTQRAFLLLKVEDMKALGLINYIVLQQYNSEVHASPTSSSFSAFNPCSKIGSGYAFWVSYDGNKDRLLAYCDLSQHTLLEDIEFASEEPLLLHQLAVLVRSTSSQSSHNNILTEDSSYFTRLVWECIPLMCPHLTRRNAQSCGPVEEHELKTLMSTRYLERKKVGGLPYSQFKQIFPWDCESARSDDTVPHSAEVEQLCRILIGNHRSHTPEHAAPFVVRSISFGKKQSALQHEFILIEVEDTGVPGLRNYLILDRLPGKNLMPTARANDQFRISRDGNWLKLLDQCGFDPYDILERITPPAERPIPLYPLILLANAVSARRKRYDIRKASCYWFAGLIWECTLEMYPEVHHMHMPPKKLLKSPVRGNFHTLKHHCVDVHELQAICDKVKTTLLNLAPGPTKITQARQPRILDARLREAWLPTLLRV